MSFGFGVGDFIAVGELCWKIYTRVYKVSRDAPEELRALIQELGNLSNTVNLLNEEVRDQEEWIKRAGERRLEYTCKVMSQAKETLQKMDRLADKYAELDPGVNSQGSKRSLRIQWSRIKYAFEVSSINELRAKFTSHNFHLTLLLQGAQNSSLERIEQQQTKTDIKLEELRNVLIGDRHSRDAPLLKVPLDEQVRVELSAAFLRSAETDNRPWASIGIDDWLCAGKWWLLKVRSQMNRLTEGNEIKVHAYINLLKACWILADIVSIHPQRVHLGASNDRRNEDIRNLSQIAKRNLEDFPVFEFQLHDVKDNTINIWPQSQPLVTTGPRRDFGFNRDSLRLQISEGEVLFQCFAEVKRTSKGTEECFLILEVPQQGVHLNVMLKDFAAHDISKMKLKPRQCNHYMWFVGSFLESLAEKLGSTIRILNNQDSDALGAILRGFRLFENKFQPKFLTVSMLHSVSVLANWPDRDSSCLLLPEYDAGSPASSDSLALLLRAIISDVVENRYQDKSPGWEFFAKDCLDGEFLPLGTFVWKVICWHCEKFADMKLLLEGFNITEDLHNSLVQTAFLRLDRSFLSQMILYLERRDGWYFDDVLFMVKAALSSNDAGYLLSILEHGSARMLSKYQTAIIQLVYSSRRLGHIDAMIQVIVPRPADIAATLAWQLSSSDEQSFGDFLHMVESQGGFFKGKTAEEVDASDFFPAFVAGCGRLIETQRSNTLSLYLDSLEKLGIDFYNSKGCTNTQSSQLAVLLALLSPHPSFLRVLLEREVVMVIMAPFVMEYQPPRSLGPAVDFEDRLREREVYYRPRYEKVLTAADFRELVQWLPPPMPRWHLYCAVKLVCDIGFMQLLCRYDASLQQESSANEDKENKAQEIVEHLSRLSNLEDARREHMDTLLLCRKLIVVGTKGVNYSIHSGILNATINTAEYRETWRCMRRLLCRDSFFHKVCKSTWKPNPQRLSELMSMYTKFPGLCPKHLRTQSGWDKWRGDALQILSELI